jgi:hypothetical protein
MKMHPVVSKVEPRNFMAAVVAAVMVVIFLSSISLGEDPLRRDLPRRAVAGTAGVVIAASVNFVVLGDVHYDKLEFHDLDWVKNKWVNPDDHRQITQEYTVFTAQNWDKLMKAVERRIGEGDGKVKGIVQLGDLMEGIAGSPELAKKMNNGSVQALKEPNFSVPWILVKGNHDGRYGPGEAEAYNEIMVPFRNKQLGITTASISFRYKVGDVEFFCPDSEMKPDELIAFLEKGLTESTAKFKFVAMHIPMIPVTGRCWDVFKFNDMKTRAENQERLLGLIAKNKAIVLCAHLHRYSVVRRETKQGPVVQVMVNSVIRDGNSPPPYWYSKEFGPGMVDMEPNFAPATQEQRREVLRQEAKYVTDFRIADLPGYAVLAIKGDRVSLRMYRGVSNTVQEEVDLTKMLEKSGQVTDANANR